jgi:hypothetical protein
VGVLENSRIGMWECKGGEVRKGERGRKGEEER